VENRVTDRHPSNRRAETRFYLQCRSNQPPQARFSCVFAGALYILYRRLNAMYRERRRQLLYIASLGTTYREVDASYFLIIRVSYSAVAPPYSGFVTIPSGVRVVTSLPGRGTPERMARQRNVSENCIPCSKTPIFAITCPVYANSSRTNSNGRLGLPAEFVWRVHK